MFPNLTKSGTAIGNHKVGLGRLKPLLYTVELRCNDPLNNEVIDITNDFFYPRSSTENIWERTSI